MPQEDLYDRIRQGKISDLIPDDQNANQGTERGDFMLARTIQKLGAGRSVLLDKNGRIIAGNKTSAKFGELGLQDVIVVQTTGKELVAVQRTDLDIDSPEGREMALADNRVGEINLSWDTEALIELNNDGLIDIDEFWLPHEQETLLVDGEEGDGTLDERDTPQMADTGGKVPLAIVLEPHEKDAWEQTKHQLGYASDGKAFRAMWEQWREGSIRE